MNFLINDLNLYYEKYGTGSKNIVILPGWGDTRGTFTNLINALQSYYTIYIVDFPGFGNSPFPNHDLTIYDYATLILDFIKITEIDNPILIGHSFGGRVIITMTGYYKYACEKIILIDSAGIKPRKSIITILKQTTYKLLKKIGKILPRKYRKNYLNYLIKIFGSTDYKNLNINKRKTFINIVNEDLSYYLKDIKAETLLIWGEKDIDTPLKDGKKMEQNIQNSSLVTIKDATHFCYLERPKLIYDIIVEFIK